MKLIEVILPVPMRQTFTYHLEEENAAIEVGARVVVHFGGQKYMTGIVKNTKATIPEGHPTKAIISILDQKPLITKAQIRLWQWMANYYMCSVGEVMKAALPAGLRMENKASVFLNPGYCGNELLKGNAAKIYHLLSDGKAQELTKLVKHIEIKTAMPLLRRLADKGLISIEDRLKKKYTPHLHVFFSLAKNINNDNAEREAFNLVKKAKKQQAFLSILLHDYEKKEEQHDKHLFLKTHGFSAAIYKALLKKGLIEETLLEVSRFEVSRSPKQALQKLSQPQQKVLEATQAHFARQQPVLLHGVTASGKTEVYMHLIQQQLEAEKQVLFLLPEIAITTEMWQRLSAVFGDKISIYHSRYSNAQRVEVWRKINDNKGGHVVLGARSAIFLPFQNLGLIVVDEEHEESYKQTEPAPRYHARDTAVILAQQHEANIILGSATPSIESAYNGQQGKYAVVHLLERYSKVALPAISPVDMAEAYKKNRRKHHFSFELIEAIKTCLKNKEQVILFQNRRGYSGFIECKSCGYVPQCQNCDISLTYHRLAHKLACHYCGSEVPYPKHCPKCHSSDFNNKGMGTEKIAEQAKAIFPEALIQRFDQDSTKGKGDFEKIISRFQERKIDLLIGTQMIAKGLDFNNVGLVAIMNADNMMNYPDFRSHEKAFQMMSQVAGRAGRRQKQGKVILQSYTPDYSLIQSVIAYDYAAYFKQQITERQDFHYPPFVKLINITVRHRERHISKEAADVLTSKIRGKFGHYTLGPETPAVGRIKLLYLHKTMLKIPQEYPLQATKDWLIALVEWVKKVERYKGISVIFEVDV